MSLLMEALRKAEEAKRKEAEKQGENNDKLEQQANAPAAGGFDLEESEGESDTEESSASANNLQIEFNSASRDSKMGKSSLSLEEESGDEIGETGFDADLSTEESGSSSTWSNLDLHPMQSPEPDTLDDTVSETDTDSDDSISFDPLDEATDKAEEAESDEQSDYADDLEDSESPLRARSPNEVDDAESELERAAWLSRAKKVTNPQPYRKYAVLAVLFLLPVAGGLYWFVGKNSQPSAPLVQNRGFLADPAEEVIVEEPIAAVETPIAVEPISPGVVSLPVSEEIEIQSDNLAQTSNVANGETALDGLVGVQIIQSAVFQLKPVPRQAPASASLQPDVERQDSSNTRREFESRLKSQPNDRSALLGLANLNLKEGNTAAAQIGFERLLELNPKDALAQAGILETNRSGDKIVEEATLRSLIEENPQLAPLSFALGNLLASQELWHDAEAAYRTALAGAKLTGGPISPDYPFNLAVALEQLNQPSAAHRYYLEALELSRLSSPSFDPNLLQDRLSYLEQQF